MRFQPLEFFVPAPRPGAPLSATSSTEIDDGIEHAIAIEGVAPGKAPTHQHVWKPGVVVFPHAIKRQVVDGAPERDGLVGFRGRAFIARGGEDVAVDGLAVDKLEMEQSGKLHPGRGDAQLLLRFADGALARGFAGFDLPSRAVDLALAEAALFMDE